MQEVIQSIQLVTQATGFYWYVGLIITVGMLAGAKFDNHFAGFMKSVVLIAPYTAVLFLTTSTRVYQTSLVRPLSPDAYNSTVTLVLITVAYILGLFLGHMAVKKGEQHALKGNV